MKDHNILELIEKHINRYTNGKLNSEKTLEIKQHKIQALKELREEYLKW